MKLISALCIATAALFAQQTASAAAFTNGNFEAAGVPAGTQTPIAPGSEPTGWQAGGTAISTEFNIFYENGVWGVDGVDGPNIVGFGGDGTTGASISQTFDTQVGTNYTVSYFITAQQGSGDQSLSASVSNGNAVLTTSAVAIPGYDTSTENYHWTAESFRFTATGASSTLTFLDTSDAVLSAGVNWGLDAVDVTASSSSVSAVPESTPLAMVSAGLGLLAFVRMRKRRGSRDGKHVHPR